MGTRDEHRICKTCRNQMEIVLSLDELGHSGTAEEREGNESKLVLRKGCSPNILEEGTVYHQGAEARKWLDGEKWGNGRSLRSEGRRIFGLHQFDGWDVLLVMQFSVIDGSW